MVRRLSSLLTFVVVSVVVLVLAVLLSFAAGIRASLKSSGHPENILVLKSGATAESTSILSPDEVNRMVQTPGVANSTTGELLISPELCVQTSIPRQGSGAMANVAIRGVEPMAFEVHPEVRIVAGRCFEPGVLEAVVGKAASERFSGLQVGSLVQLGRLNNQVFEVVGIFEAGGNAFESEIWTARTTLASSYDRRYISSVAMRIESPAAVPTSLDYINGPAVRLQAKTELNYYEELSSKTREIVLLSSVLIFIMGIGAVFAVANTMHAAVDSRRREIAMLRTLGFSRRSIGLAFWFESLIICLLACGCGLAGSMAFSGTKQDFLSDATWTVLAYQLQVTPDIALTAIILAVTVGTLGAVLPAWRASRVPILEALRKA
ncbi:MAG: hypothetical protein HJJLKODD_01419 [Phycisphaerae bacterium]|nr:hypothetical protein [Phycisphaerae bacterium]